MSKDTKSYLASATLVAFGCVIPALFIGHFEVSALLTIGAICGLLAHYTCPFRTKP